MLLRILQNLLILIALTSAKENLDYPDEPARATPIERSWRLPNTTYPLRYYLHITTHVHREIFDYSSNCTIEIVVQKTTDEIVMHAKDFEITTVILEDLTAKTVVEDVVYTRDEAKDLLIIRAEDSSPTIFLRNHHLRLSILYRGVIRDEVMGFHRLSYEDSNNKTVFGANTQFEPTHARSALPCYDEPSYKSNFTVCLTHGSNYTAISNMPQISMIIDSKHNMTTTTFLETPPMTTYLLAFVISNFKNISAVSDGIVQRVFMPPDSNKFGYVPLQNAMKAIKVFSNYLDVPYSLPKMDHIEVRESFGLAMENWGLITYTNNALLDTNDTSQIQKSFMHAYTQNHELAHQWFGNLVTPAWWNSLWLSEGFATYYSFVVTEMINDKIFNALDTFNMIHCQQALYEQDTTPISTYVETPKEIMESFNFGMYAKAPCLIQMFDHLFGQEIFQNGISNYIKTHAYSVADENNLFDALQSAAFDYHVNRSQTWSYNVDEIMKSWTHSVGHPLVIITRNYDDNSIHIHQKSDRNMTNGLWWIPLNFATASQPNFESTKADFYMPPIHEMTIHLSNLNITLKDNDWLIVNKQGKGFYDVVYDAESLRRIATALQQDHNAIHRLNRAYILRNIIKSWLNDENVDLQTVLELVKYLNREKDAFVWLSAEDLLDLTGVYLEKTTIDALYKNFVRNLIAPTYEYYMSKSVQTLSIIEIHLKEKLRYLGCEMKLPACLNTTKEYVIFYPENISKDGKSDMFHNYLNKEQIYKWLEMENELSNDEKMK